MRSWSDTEHRRFTFRVALFQRRGLCEADAEGLADQLALRDQQHDDRRLCLECANLQRSGHCVAAKQGRIQVACDPSVFTVMPRLLARCAAFAWVTP